MAIVQTHYDNLKVARNAPSEVIRAAYRTLSQKYHPDRNPGNQDAVRIMAILNTSYEVLSDPEKRQEHDRWIEEQEQAHRETYASHTQARASKVEPVPAAVASVASGNYSGVAIIAFGLPLLFLVVYLVGGVNSGLESRQNAAAPITAPASQGDVSTTISTAPSTPVPDEGRELSRSAATSITVAASQGDVPAKSSTAPSTPVADEGRELSRNAADSIAVPASESGASTKESTTPSPLVAELAKERGCLSPPVLIDGTNLYKCKTQTMMDYFPGPMSMTDGDASEKLRNNSAQSAVPERISQSGRSATVVTSAGPELTTSAKRLPAPEATTLVTAQAPEVGRGDSLTVAGKIFRDCADCAEMVVIPAGSFLMGSPGSEYGRSQDEGPQHEVRIKSFAAGRYEVTFDQWNICVSAGGCGGYRPADGGWGRDNRPAIFISWADSRLYAQWMSQKTGKTYRLLTEAEWEYAARSGSTTRYSFGDDDAQLGNHAWYVANSGRRSRGTRPVGTARANAFGLHDMHGNAQEWVEDCWNDSYASASANGNALLTGDCTRRVYRGGSWSGGPGLLRSARRDGSGPSERNSFLGFRLARTLP